MLVFGGSLGARSINEAAVTAWGAADPGFRVLHTAGERDLADLARRLGDPPPAWYDLRGFIAGFGEALLACDLVVARSGGSIFEVAAAGRPAILVPYPHAAADHQAENARWMERAGAAIVIDDGEVTAERLAREVAELLADHVAPQRDGRRLRRARPAGRGPRHRGRAARRRGGKLASSPMPDPRPWTGRRLHFVGIGGVGMSGYATVSAQLGATVTGSDRAASPALERLVAAGIDARAGHDCRAAAGRRRRRGRGLERDRGGQPRDRGRA